MDEFKMVGMQIGKPEFMIGQVVVWDNLIGTVVAIKIEDKKFWYKCSFMPEQWLYHNALEDYKKFEEAMLTMPFAKASEEKTED